MWARTASCGRYVALLFLSLLVQHHVMASRAAAVVQLKNQQHHQPSTALGQQQQQQQQQHHHVQSQQKEQQSGMTTHPSVTSDTKQNSAPSSAASATSSSSSTLSATNLPTAQFPNDKEETAAARVDEVFKHFNADDGLGSSYQLLNELKRPPPPMTLPFTAGGAGNNYPWNLFDRSPYGSGSFNGLSMPSIAGIFPHMFGAFEGYPTTFPVTPRFMPIMSYPQPILVPYPFYMTPEIFYPGFSGLSGGLNNYEDTMSRDATSVRRPSPNQHPSPSSAYARNSPIYYVRLPPTPYMFMPSLGLGATSPAMTGFPTMLPYQSLPTFPSFSSIFNVPINFLANGKPTGIYQVGGSPNDIQASIQYSPGIATTFNNHLSAPPTPPLSSASAGSFRPSSTLAHHYVNNLPSNSPPSAPSQNYGPSYPGPQNGVASSLQDSKLTSLKRPYYFNGRPEDIYILPNSINALYSSENSYY